MLTLSSLITSLSICSTTSSIISRLIKVITIWNSFNLSCSKPSLKIIYGIISILISKSPTPTTEIFHYSLKLNKKSKSIFAALLTES